MKIYDEQGRLVLDVLVDDNSYRYREIMGDDSLTLYFQLPEHVEIPKGAFVVYEGRTYTLERPSNLVMKHTRYFEYTVTFESSQAKAKIWKFRHCVMHEHGGVSEDGGDGRLKFDLVAKPHEHLQMFVDNMNRRDSGWRIGGCIEGDEKLVTYDHAYCLEALQQMADAFETEFAIEGKVVYLRRVEYYKDSPLHLSYGKGNGFVSGVGRRSEEGSPAEILFVQGGTDNIDARPVEQGGYGNKYLLLPKNATIRFDGEKFEGEEGFNHEWARTYGTDAQGLSIRRADKELTTMAEASLDCSEIYPKRVGVVDRVICVDEEDNFYDFTDADPAIPNYRDYRINDETMTVIFQSGMLSGREFECNYIHEAVAGKLPRRFELKPDTKDGIPMPDARIGFAPVSGDKYAVFHCRLPQEYITAAEWEMFKAGVRHFYNQEGEKFSFTGTLDAIWAKRDWRNISAKIVLGGYVRFTDARFLPDGLNIRITGIKDYINNPHAPELTLSNESVSGGFSSTMKKLESQEVHVEALHSEALQFTKRRFRDAREMTNALASELPALQQSLMQYFTENIAPIAVQTMQLLVGDERLQFCFVDDVGARVSDGIVCENGHIKCEPRVIQHLTLGVDRSITTGRGDGDYYFFDMPHFDSGELPEGVCYLYAIVMANRRGLGGRLAGGWEVVQNIKPFKSGGEYYLLVGIVGSAEGGERSWMPLYGFTEIVGGRITTDRIVSANGNTYFDLTRNEIGGVIKFLAGGGTYDLGSFYSSATESIESMTSDISTLTTAANNLRFLLNTFGDGNTIIAGGAVISGFMGVKNAAEEVVAAISGKDYLNTGNSPMIYAGAEAGDVRLYGWRDITPNGPVDTEGRRIVVYTTTETPDNGSWVYRATGVVIGSVSMHSSSTITMGSLTYNRRSAEDITVNMTALRNSDNAKFRVYRDGVCASRYFRVEGTMITPFFPVLYDSDAVHGGVNPIEPSDLSLRYLIQQNGGLSNVCFVKRGTINDIANPSQHPFFGLLFVSDIDQYNNIIPYTPVDGFTMHFYADISPTQFQNGANVSTNIMTIRVYTETNQHYFDVEMEHGSSCDLCYIASNNVGWTVQRTYGNVTIIQH